MTKQEKENKLLELREVIIKSQNIAEILEKHDLHNDSITALKFLLYSAEYSIKSAREKL